VVYTFNGKNYFAPLHSPKEKHKKISHKALDIFKIKDGELGVVNINNMIPTPMEVLTEAIPTIKDIKYKKLLEQQLTYLNNNKKELYNKIQIFYKLYLIQKLPERVLDRTCDFNLLEDKLAEYENSKK